MTPGTASTTTRETAHRNGSSGVRNDASKIRPGRSTASTRSGVIPRGASGRTNPAARPRRTRPTTYGSRIRRATRPTTEAAVTRITKTRMASTGLLCILGVCRLWGASVALAGSRAGIAAPALPRWGTATGTAPRWPPGIGPRSAATGSRRDAILPGMASRRASDLVGSLVDGLVDHPTRRRGGVFRRALRRQFSRLHDRRRLLAVLLLALAGGIGLAGKLAAGEHAGQPDPAGQREEEHGEQPAPVVEPGELASEGPSEDPAPPARRVVHQPVHQAAHQVRSTPGCHAGEYRIAPGPRRCTPRPMPGGPSGGGPGSGSPARQCRLGCRPGPRSRPRGGTL